MFTSSLLRKSTGSVLLGAAALSTVALSQKPSAAEEDHNEALAAEFAYLSENGNSNCSLEFREAIATMPAIAMLRGSCCSPMDEHRYVEQINGLRQYAGISAVPPNPYSIPVGLAREHMANYSIELSSAEQAAYDHAVENSDEGGPCCCPCWRWEMYGGLAKLLITEHGFTGQQIAEIWNLSDGCGGGEDHSHA